MAKRSGYYHDWGKTYRAFSYALKGAGAEMAEDTKRDFDIMAKDYLKELDAQWPHGTTLKNGAKFGGDHDHPWYSGQLHDSVAIRVAEKNRTISVHYMPPSPDTGEPQEMGNIKDIVGVEWAHEVAEGKVPYYFLPGIQLQFVVAVPYTEKVNESARHAGFFEELSNGLINKADEWVNSGVFRRRKYYADGKVHTHKRVR